MNGLQREREKKSNEKKNDCVYVHMYVKRRLCSILIGEQALFVFCVQ
jgi:hypothetical protein